jgi:hypothetical protein
MTNISSITNITVIFGLNGCFNYYQRSFCFNYYHSLASGGMHWGSLRKGGGGVFPCSLGNFPFVPLFPLQHNTLFPRVNHKKACTSMLFYIFRDIYLGVITLTNVKVELEHSKPSWWLMSFHINILHLYCSANDIVKLIIVLFCWNIQHISIWHDPGVSTKQNII